MSGTMRWYRLCYRKEQGIPHGEQYEKCVAVHAEQNAIISASRAHLMGADMYLVGFEYDGQELEDVKPCLICERMIKNAGIRQIITK